VSSDIKEENPVITTQNVQLPKSYLGDEQFPRENEAAPLEGWFYADKMDLIAAIVASFDDVQVLSHREIRDRDKVWTSLRLYGPYAHQVDLCRFELESHISNSAEYLEGLAPSGRPY
jgi:hypothetical protein